jgi:hypothetical protein
MASSFKGELKGERQIVIVQVREPKRIREAFEKELEKLTDILVNKKMKQLRHGFGIL